MSTVRHLLSNKGYEVITIDPEATVYDALRLMGERSIGALVVTEGDKLTGVLSERDYARKVILKGKRSRETPVRDIMSGEPVTVSAADTIEACMKLMTEHRVRHLPVLDEGKLVGLISMGDVVKAIMSQQAFMIEQLENYIGGNA